MVILGITGGVGSGKSRILSLLKEDYNAYVVEADKVAHELMLPGEDIYNKIVDHFGNEILTDTEPYTINRTLLGNIVFNSMEKLELLNSITHPMVKDRIIHLIKLEELKGTKLFVIEAALLIECGYQDICDEIWYVWVDKEERIKRLIESRGYSREKCISIFDNQKNDEFYIDNSNKTINNQNSFEQTKSQLKDLLNKLLNNDIIS